MIDFVLLHEKEKRRHDGVVIRLAWSRERLDNLVHTQQLAESLRSILFPLVTIKHQRPRGISVVSDVL